LKDCAGGVHDQLYRKCLWKQMEESGALTIAVMWARMSSTLLSILEYRIF
jgi:hypothetical protein